MHCFCFFYRAVVSYKELQLRTRALVIFCTEAFLPECRLSHWCTMKNSNTSIALDPVNQEKPIWNPEYWDRILIAAIFVGMVGFAYAMFSSSLLQPLITAAQKHHWNALLLRPTVIWVGMGFLLLLLRT